MKVLILNGSPRPAGNSANIVSAVADGFKNNTSAEVEVVRIQDLAIKGCLGCNYCREHDGQCVQKDDIADVENKIEAADAIIMVSPIYCWDITTQLKSVVDRLYCKAGRLEGKKFGVIIAGGAQTDHFEYDMIKKMFDCVIPHFKAEFVDYSKVYAYQLGEVKENTAFMAEMAEYYKKFQ